MTSNHVAEGFIQSGLEKLQRWRLRTLSGQAVLVLDCPHHKISPFIESEPLISVLPIVSCPPPWPLVLPPCTTVKSLALSSL